jgi:hypothetical protein
MSDEKNYYTTAEGVLAEMRGGSLPSVSPGNSRDIIARALAAAHAAGVAEELARRVKAEDGDWNEAIGAYEWGPRGAPSAEAAHQRCTWCGGERYTCGSQIGCTGTGYEVAVDEAYVAGVAAERRSGKEESKASTSSASPTSSDRTWSRICAQLASR